MTALTFDIDAEIDKVWHFDIGQIGLLIHAGPYAKHILEGFNLDSATYELLPDSNGRVLKIVENTVGVVNIIFRVGVVGTNQSASLTTGVPISGLTGQDTLTFLGALGLIGKTDYVFGGVTVTPSTIAKDSSGNLWRHTGHFTADGEPYFRSTQNLSDQGLTVSALNTAHGPLSVFHP